MEFEREFLVLADRIQIRYYGIIIVLAMLVAATVAARLARRERRNPDHIWGALTWAIIPAIVGARLWFVLFPPASLVSEGLDAGWFLQNFFNLENGAIAIWSGGLSIFGAVLGGALGAWLYFSRYHNTVVRIISTIFLPITFVFNLIGNGINWLLARVGIEPAEPEPVEPFPDEGIPIAPWLDIAAVALPLDQAIGRWANFINQELYGVPTSLPWGIPIELAKRVDPYTSPVDFPTASTRFHPLFLYESLWSLLFFIVLLNLFLRYRDRLRTGDIFLVYLIQYSFIRFLLEGIRVEVTYLPGTEINLSQAFMVVVFILSLAALAYRHRPGAVPAQRPPGPQHVSENT